MEQHFNLLDWLAPKRRNLDEQTELDHLTVVTHPSSDSVDEIVMRAQNVWAELYGTARTSKQRLQGYTTTKRKVV